MKKKTMGQVLKELRLEKGVSQKEVATAVKTTDVTIGRYENGDREPKGDMLYSIVLLFSNILSLNAANLFS